MQKKVYCLMWQNTPVPDVYLVTLQVTLYLVWLSAIVHQHISSDCTHKTPHLLLSLWGSKAWKKQDCGRENPRSNSLNGPGGWKLGREQLAVCTLTTAINGYITTHIRL